MRGAGPEEALPGQILYSSFVPSLARISLDFIHLSPNLSHDKALLTLTGRALASPAEQWHLSAEP